jgi:hypothetical protein
LNIGARVGAMVSTVEIIPKVYIFYGSNMVEKFF